MSKDLEESRPRNDCGVLDINLESQVVRTCIQCCYFTIQNGICR